MFSKRSIVFIFTIILLIASRDAHGYGPAGHKLVGAIADARMAAQHPQIKAKIKQLLDGLTLEEAAVLPDTIKSKDNKPASFKFPRSPRIQQELIDFMKANPHFPKKGSSKVNHRTFHYTDIEVATAIRYNDADIGRPDTDIVHMIPFCYKVLHGDVSANNKYKITKTIAVILLAHYLGDIHQPLHVGAEYFDEDGNPANPETTDAMDDEGGNKITPDDDEIPAKSLHAFWDNKAVSMALANWRPEYQAAHPAEHGRLTNDKIAAWLATQPPAHWSNSAIGNPDAWTVELADEILPIAREAHTRLVFTDVDLDDHHHLSNIVAHEKKPYPAVRYVAWAAATVQREIHLAGWRLEQVLVEAVR